MKLWDFHDVFSPLTSYTPLPLLKEAVFLSLASKRAKGTIPSTLERTAKLGTCGLLAPAHRLAMARGMSEDQHHLQRASGKGIFPRKAAGVCPSPSDIPSKRPL